MERKRIGIFVDYFEQFYQSSVIRACLNRFEALGHDIIVFSAGDLVHTDDFYTKGNFLFDLAKKNIDGLLLLGGSFASQKKYNNSLQFLSELKALPMVSISLPFENIPCVMASNYIGMKRLVNHLVVEHRHTKIGFLKKKDGHFEGEQRFQAWKDALTDHGVEILPNLVLSGDHYWDAMETVKTLFDDRALVPGRDIEALVCVDSFSAANLWPQLKKRGIRVPEDLALVCFDYVAEKRLPFQTTCEAQPYDLLIATAIENLFQLIEGNPVPTLSEVPTLSVPGNSCGCQDPFKIITQDQNPFTFNLSSELKNQFEQDLQKLAATYAQTHEDRENPFAFFLSQTANGTASFLDEKLMFTDRRYFTLGKIAHTLLSTQAKVSPDFWNTLASLIYETQGQRLQLQSTRAATYRDTDVKVRATMSKVFSGRNTREILETIFKHLFQLGIHQSFVFLYDKKTPSNIIARLEDSQIKILENPPLPDHLVHEQFFGQTPRSFYALIPLIAREDPLGFLGIEIPKEYWEDFFVFETIRQVLSGALQSCLDVEEKERSLEELQKTREQLLVSEKMALLGGLVAGMSHEINTPIGNAVTAASFLHDQADQIQRIMNGRSITKSEVLQVCTNLTSAAEMVLINCQRAAELIQSFKHISVDQTSNQLREFNLADYLDEIILSLQPQLKKTNVKVTVSCSRQINIQSFPGSFSQVVSNLIMNSLIHGFKEAKEGEIVMVVTQENSDFLIMQYADDGVGMSAESLSHLFEPFYTSMKNSGGSGLGTYTIYNIVTQKLKGSVHAESQPGKGLRYTFRLPLYGLDIIES